MSNEIRANSPVGAIPRLADRVAPLKQTSLRRLSARCAELKGVNLSQGVCDLPTPAVLTQGVQAALEAGECIYTHVAGMPSLRKAIARKLRDFNKLEFDPETEIAVTVGSAGAFSCAAMSLINPGDEVVLFSPYYNYYLDTLRLLGAKARFVKMHPPDWRIDPKDLEAAFAGRPAAVVVNSPNNPTGKVFTEAEFTQIVQLAATADAWIISDEVYEYITYDQPHLSIATLPGARNRTVTLSGPSKTYAVTGWRIGYAAGPAELIAKMLVVNDLLYICAPAPLQRGVEAGLGLPDSYYEGMRADYRTKRDMLCGALHEAGFTPYVPEGAFYTMAAFEAGRFASSLAAAEAILESVGVASVPGAAFHADPSEGETQLRFCFAKRMEDLEEGCRRLRSL